MSTQSRKVFYSMGEVAEMFDVNQSLIRFWEKKFDILKPHKNKKGNRMFTTADVENIRLIYHLSKEQGMKLDAVQRRLRQNPDMEKSKAEALERLYAIRAMLLEVRQELKLGGDVINDEAAYDRDGDQAVKIAEIGVKPEPVAVAGKAKSAPVRVQSESEPVQIPVSMEPGKAVSATVSAAPIPVPTPTLITVPVPVSAESARVQASAEPKSAEPKKPEKPQPRIIEQTLF